MDTQSINYVRMQDYADKQYNRKTTTVRVTPHKNNLIETFLFRTQMEGRYGPSSNSFLRPPCSEYDT